MKLLYPLPEREAALVETNGEKILYCIPADLSPDGIRTEGWSVVTEGRFVSLEEGRITRELQLTHGRDYRAVALVGNGQLEAQIEGESFVLARYTMAHVPRYATIARALNLLLEGKAARFVSFEERKTCPRCGRMFPRSSEVCPSCIKKTTVFLRLARLARSYTRPLLLVLLLFLAGTGVALLIPQLYRILIDGVIVAGRREIRLILLLVSAVGLSHFVNALLRVIRSRLLAWIGNSMSKDMRAMVFGKIQALSIRFLSRHKTGDLMNRVNSDTQRIQRFVEQAAGLGIGQMFLFLGVGAILFLRDWRLALLILVPTPLVTLFMKSVWHAIRVIYRRQRKLFDRVNSMLQDILSGIRVVKAFGKENWEVDRFRGASDDLRAVTERNEKIWGSLIPLISFVIGAGHFLVLYYGGRLVLGERMALGELVQFSEYARMLYGPLAWLAAIPKMFMDALVATERIFEIIDEEPDVRDSESPSKRRRFEGRVVFRDVTFGYHSHVPVLDSINLETSPGEMIGLVGHSGAGKSTLINLLLRLYDVDEGAIQIDGVDIRDIGLVDLRSQIGVVLQETFLFSGSIWENIRYSKPDAGHQEIIRAAKIAHAHDFIIHFADGYDTRVGEKGQRLSTGERQRIAIARAILHDPRILILDEATSAVDTETEQKIQDALANLIKDRTTFAIAHRLATLRNASRLVVLDQGRLAESGTHGELMELRGIYHDLILTQRRMSQVKGVAG
jgi:ATP-binding cassette subfamily B protein